MTFEKSAGAVAGALALLLTASTIAGCGGSAPPPTDPSAAREFLSQALEAWKSGEPKGSLVGGSPSIIMKDPDWERESKLLDYELGGEGHPLGAGIQWTVPLTLSAGGKTVERKAVYVVNVGDGNVAVWRQDMDF